jgi:CRP/FNR family transcriptional regulator
MQLHVASNPLLTDAAAPVARRLPQPWTSLPFSAARRIKAKEYLVLEGDPHRLLFQVVAGAVALAHVSPDGRRQIVRFAFAGDLIGLHWDAVEPLSAQATCESVVRSAPFSSVIRAAEEQQALRSALAVAMGREMKALRDHVTAVCAGGAAQRVAFLLEQLLERVATREAGRDVIVLPMTRLDMGDYLGLTIETVSRELSRLRQAGVIEIDRVTRVVVKDRRKLVAVMYQAETI